MEKIEPLKKVENIEIKEKTGVPTISMGLRIGVVASMILLGIGTGYLISRTGSSASTNGSSVVSTADGKKVFGSSDTKNLTDSAIGTIEKEGINEEGTHKLVREGGPSQTACLVSSVLDLDEFIGKKVKILGITMDAKSCPWLLDVGRIELLE